MSDLDVIRPIETEPSETLPIEPKATKGITPIARFRRLKGHFLRDEVATVSQIQEFLCLPSLVEQLVHYWQGSSATHALAVRDPKSIKQYTAELFNQLEAPARLFQSEDDWTTHAI